MKSTHLPKLTILPQSSLNTSQSSHLRRVNLNTSRPVSLTPVLPRRTSPSDSPSSRIVLYDSPRVSCRSPHEISNRNHHSRKLLRSKSPEMESIRNNYSQVIGAVFKMTNCIDNKIEAVTLAQFFLDLKLITHKESNQIFTGLFKPNMLATAVFSDSELLQICKNSKVENLHAFLLSLANQSQNSSLPTISSLITQINHLYTQLQHKFSLRPSLKQVHLYLLQQGLSDVHSDLFHLFPSSRTHLTYRKFSGLFSKALLKFLFSHLIHLLDSHSWTLTSPALILSAERRRVFLSSLAL
jgi:hypothetical protein